MSTTEVTGSSDADVRIGPGMDLKLEVVVLPVSDVDRAKTFYERLGWRLDADVDVEGFTLVQLTPPGSRCSIQFGTHATTATPGSVQNVYLVVTDIEAVRRELLDRGVEVSDTFHEGSIGGRFDRPGSKDRLDGASPDGGSYASFASFSDPDGNSWLLQEITTPL